MYFCLSLNNQRLLLFFKRVFGNNLSGTVNYTYAVEAADLLKSDSCVSVVIKIRYFAKIGLHYKKTLLVDKSKLTVKCNLCKTEFVECFYLLILCGYNGLSFAVNKSVVVILIKNYAEICRARINVVYTGIISLRAATRKTATTPPAAPPAGA